DGAPRAEGREAAAVPLGKPRPDEDAVGAIFTELDRRPEGVERRDDVAALIRHEQLHDLEPRLEPLGYTTAERVEALAVLRGALERPWEAVLEPLPRL